jgi:hypothetical protein
MRGIFIRLTSRSQKGSAEPQGVSASLQRVDALILALTAGSRTFLPLILELCRSAGLRYWCTKRLLTARHVFLDSSAAMIKLVPRYYKRTVYPPPFSRGEDSDLLRRFGSGASDFALLRLYQPLGDHHIGFFGVRTYKDDWNDLSVWAAVGHPSMAPFSNEIPSCLIGVSVSSI